MHNPMITTVVGWSETVEERARRLLRFEIGAEGPNGTPVTVATMLARCNYDPLEHARLLIVAPPLAAVKELTRIVGLFEIQGERCSDPAAMARAALSHAGRVVTHQELYPELYFVLTLFANLVRGVRRSP